MVTRGPCSAKADAAWAVLGSLSGDRVNAKNNASVTEQPWRCRKAGYRYFAAAGYVFQPLWGTCLPAMCAFSSQAELLHVSNLVLGKKVLQEQIHYVTPLAGFEQEVETPTPEPGWHAVSLTALCEGTMAGFPNEYYQTNEVALAFNEFRGNSRDYIEAAMTAISCFLENRHTNGHEEDEIDVTWFLPGSRSENFPVAPHIRIRAVPRNDPCSRWKLPFFDNGREVRRGLEVHISSSWRRYWFGPANIVQRWLRLAFERYTWNGISRNMICNLNLESTLRWVIPHDASRHATMIFRSGPCAMKVAQHLPELASHSLFFFANESIKWTDVYQKHKQCVLEVEGAYWSVTGSIANRLQPRRVIQNVTGFVCLPSRYEETERGPLEIIGAILPRASCDADGILEAIRLVLAFATGRYEELGVSRLVWEFRGGSRATQAASVFFVEHILKAREELEAETALNGKGLSAAVCIAGLARTLSKTEVHSSLLEFAASTKALGVDEVANFFVLDTQGRPISEFGGAFEVLPPAGLVVVNGTNWGQLPSCRAWKFCGPPCTDQFHKLSLCRGLIEIAESSRGKQFDWVLRLRPDMKFSAPVGPLYALDTAAVHAHHRPGLVDMEDHFALVPRNFVDAYFGIGNQCPSLRGPIDETCATSVTEETMYPECAFVFTFLQRGVRIATFPKIWELVRDATCTPETRMWVGLQRSDACGSTGN